MNCEYCGRRIFNGDTVHGIRYGTADNLNKAFLPARESAWTVICELCAEKMYRQIYSSLRTVQGSHRAYIPLKNRKL
jgi:hypothetical protein